MSSKREPSNALRAALAELAAADAPGLIEEARRRANLRARDLIEEELVQELLRAAARPHGHQEPQRSSPAHSDRSSPTQPERSSAGQASLSGSGAWWAYCVIRAGDGDAIPSTIAGIEPGTRVQIVTEGELAALVSEVPLAQYNDERLREHLEDLAWVERIARAHEAVLERALSAATIVPLRLCTIYRDIGGVARLLQESGEALLEGLVTVDGCVELGAKVFAARGREAPIDGVGEGSGSHGASSGTAYLSRRQHERDRAERAREVRAQCADAVHERLASLAQAATTNPPQRPEAHGREGEMLLNGAYLVARDDVADIGDAVAELRAQWEPQGFEVELTGPWPAYNFVSSAAGIVP